MKHSLLIAAFSLLACSKQDDPDNQLLQRINAPTHWVAWRNQADKPGGYGILYKNGTIAVINSNTGITTTDSFMVNNHDRIRVALRASPGEITPFGVKRKLLSTGVLEFIPGSFRAIAGGGTISYSFIIDTAYRYEIVWGVGP